MFCLSDFFLSFPAFLWIEFLFFLLTFLSLPIRNTCSFYRFTRHCQNVAGARSLPSPNWTAVSLSPTQLRSLASNYPCLTYTDSQRTLKPPTETLVIDVCFALPTGFALITLCSQVPSHRIIPSSLQDLPEWVAVNVWAFRSSININGLNSYSGLHASSLLHIFHTLLYFFFYCILRNSDTSFPSLLFQLCWSL